MQVVNGEVARRRLTRHFGDMNVPESMLKRIEETFGERLTPEQVVERILQDVRNRGDRAVQDWTAKFDGVHLDKLEVPRSVWDAAEISPDLLAAIRLSIARVRAFHQQQPVSGWMSYDDEGALGQMMRPLDRVGVYVPGGSAPLISTLIMTAVPAQVAGVRDIVMITPPDKQGKIHPAVLVAAREIGISQIFCAGGAQAIAALAYGTESIGRVDKIAGPGNTFVVIAKRQVYGQTGIEALPGPTETLVLADDTANPAFVAADLLAQAEHIGAQPVLVTPSPVLAEAVQAEVKIQLQALPEPNRSWAAESLRERGLLVLAENLSQGIELSNLYAPEHLCLLVEDPWSVLGQVRHAGGVFVGEDSMEALGDYLAGPSHVMPTGGTARFSSPVNVRDFQKIISVVGVNRLALQRTGAAAACMARAEGLEAHARAIEVRLHNE